MWIWSLTQTKWTMPVSLSDFFIHTFVVFSLNFLLLSSWWERRFVPTIPGANTHDKWKHTFFFYENYSMKSEINFLLFVDNFLMGNGNVQKKCHFCWKLCLSSCKRGGRIVWKKYQRILENMLVGQSCWIFTRQIAKLNYILLQERRDLEQTCNLELFSL